MFPDFKDPLYLLLFIPAFVFFVWCFKRRKFNAVSIALSSVKIVSSKKTLRSMVYPYLWVLRAIVISLLIIAAARPGRGVNYTEIDNYGIDIMVSLDVSGSMAGLDLKPDRLSAAKQIVKDFALSRKSDRVGFVIFAGAAYLQSPLTPDLNILSGIIDDVAFDSVDVDGTAIGDSLALSISRLRSSKAQSKIILLLTDGVNNMGSINPETAAEMSKSLGIKIYVVGIGQGGRVPYPSNNLFSKVQYIESHFDENSLRKIAEDTGGVYYRAVDEGSLEQAINDINKLETSRYSVKQYYEFFDKFFILIAAAGIIFFAEMFLRILVFRSLP